MAIDSRYKMSQERLDTLKEELHYLETTREKEVAELIKEARSFGDLSENSEYDEAKTEQGKLYSRIAEITDLIENAEVVEKVEVAADVVTIGSHVRVLDVDEDAEEEYTIVGSQEANPMEGCISDDSPFGFALKGHKVGETVTVTAPVGELQFKIIAVENEDCGVHHERREKEPAGGGRAVPVRDPSGAPRQAQGAAGRRARPLCADAL